MKRPAGTSLIELIIMLAVIAVLCGGAALCLSRWAHEARVSQARIELERIAEEYDRYVLVPGRPLPRSVGELPGYEEAPPVDPWGSPYVLKPAEPNGCGGWIASPGPDRDPETDDDLVRVMPSPKHPALPRVERAPRPPTNELVLRDLRRRDTPGPCMSPAIGYTARLMDHDELYFVDLGAKGSSYDEHRHVLALGGGRMHYRAMLPATRWTHVQVGAWFCANETRYRADADLQLTVNGKPCLARRTVEHGPGGRQYLWDVPAALVNDKYTMHIAIGVDGEGEGIARTLRQHNRLYQGCPQRFIHVDLEEGVWNAK
jgi:general secretion pathway protein G